MLSQDKQDIVKELTVKELTLIFEQIASLSFQEQANWIKNHKQQSRKKPPVPLKPLHLSCIEDISSISSISHDEHMIISCIKSSIVNGNKVHEIHLKCQGCNGNFTLSAVHDCEGEEEGDKSGLEWLVDGETSMVNLLI